MNKSHQTLAGFQYGVYIYDRTKVLNLMHTMPTSIFTVFPVKPRTPEKISGMFIVSRPNQKWDETTRHNRQTAAYISHDLIWNNELAFSSNKLAFLPPLPFKNQTTEFRIDLEAKFTMVQVFLLSYKKIRIENHQSQPISMTLWTAREAHRSAPHLVGSFFFFSVRWAV